ncbi:hypothetical protein DS62_11670 [Smithella sp. SC_K08D17]|nr:hypothetical protein KD27_05820 [Smithella sp. D17]KIE18341.1 hypothetical protein DS62_11670 [Smithella sp. SC_K08D17]
MKKKEEYQISTSVNEEILEIILTGELTSDSFKIIRNELLAIEKLMNMKNEIIDFRALKGQRSAYIEAYIDSRNIPPDRPRINTALVDIAENAELGYFFEINALKTGLSFKWVTDIDAARAWLRS